jgi:hypothetical protein
VGGWRGGLVGGLGWVGWVDWLVGWVGLVGWSSWMEMERDGGTYCEVFVDCDWWLRHGDE